MKSKYENPRMLVMVIQTADIITSSTVHLGAGEYGMEDQFDPS